MALIQYRHATFLTSAPNIRRCPDDSGREVAFAGRSNAGKSSALNRLTEQPKLARTSKTPGRTQLINFFSLSEQQRLVDLPGYGYAKAPKNIRKQWEKDLADYLSLRQSLVGCVLLMDIRHPLQPFDLNFISWSQQQQLPLHVLLTKSDKLNRGAAKSTAFKVEKSIKSAFATDLIQVQPFSSLKGDGLGLFKQRLNHWLLAEEVEARSIKQELDLEDEEE